ncbi:hypothetical protein FEA48_30735 [Pseudomonas nitroreducens]|uniref:Uncharacterized protein n=1 Tax=Pseudomonas nitroreducens TaxID=46680 RepID=A0A5R8ZQ20_PSENT|nr:hypothetical protein [Pseudomonas nitroreducens]TLP68232.1 hypothetical protein FEA48_30735 [Pseudomonas nitroreducens]
MNLGELERDFRVETGDLVPDYLFESEWVARWLAEAQDEAAIRRRLLHESENTDVCRTTVEQGRATYPLHPSLFEITSLRIRRSAGDRSRPLQIVSTEWLDSWREDWRDCEGCVEFAVQDDTTLRLVPRPAESGELLLEGYRLPLKDLTTGIGAVPEIHLAHHRRLVQWAVFRAYGLPDVETQDLARAAQAEREFTSYFGPRPDADLRRETRKDEPQHVTAWP